MLRSLRLLRCLPLGLERRVEFLRGSYGPACMIRRPFGSDAVYREGYRPLFAEGPPPAESQPIA